MILEWWENGRVGIRYAGYPEGYRDPPYDGTEADFAAKVLPARMAAIKQTLDEHLQELMPGTDLRWEWS